MTKVSKQQNSGKMMAPREQLSHDEGMTLYKEITIFEIVTNKRTGTDHFRCYHTDSSAVTVQFDCIHRMEGKQLN